MKFYYTRLQVICDPDFSEILMAEIAEAGFDTFMEIEKGFDAYGEEKKIDTKLVESIRKKYKQVNPLLLHFERVEKQNWNKEWEKNVEPINVDGKVYVRAAFHEPVPTIPYEIVITPKMSFGTGHHQTTYLMLRSQLSIDHRGKSVMDAGCGTAILSIMAAKRDAKQVEAFDIDEWSVENGRENIEVNKTPNVNIRLGSVRSLSFDSSFDIILANINKNILLDEMDAYAALLKPGGVLLLSGFYTSDIPDLASEGANLGLNETGRDEKDGWASLLLKSHLE
jgi:ribosomal protein L11 methyltransferase